MTGLFALMILGIFIIIRCLICFYLLTSDLLNEFESLTLNLHILLFFSYIPRGSAPNMGGPVCFINKPLPVDTQRLVRKYSEGTGSKPKSVNKVAVEITDTETNTISTFESIRKAAKAINSDVKSLTRYEKYLSGCGKNPVLYRNKYSVVFYRFNLNSTKPTCARESNLFSTIDKHKLGKDKLFVFLPDKITLAYNFEDCAQAARSLTPQRCAHLSDLELSRNKNVQHIRRVINKGVLTTTEKGKFYILQNPGHSTCLALVP